MERTYTIGELAELGGVSVKTLRVYERKGLLLPERNTENHYRVYHGAALRELEKIQLLKYLGFSLEQISEFLKDYERISREEMFLAQRRLLLRKREQLDSVISCVDRAITECREEETDCNAFLTALNSIIKNRRADELVWRLGQHSDEPRGWSRFVFEQAGLTKGMHVLDAGAGYGNLWRYNSDRIPESLRVTCIDKHNTHADSFAEFIAKQEASGEIAEGQFRFVWGDLEFMEFSEKYHCIFLNHVANFIQDVKALYRKLFSALSENGVFICTWGGMLLLETVKEMMAEFFGDDSLAAQKYRDISGKLEKVEAAEQKLLEVLPNAEKRRYVTTLHFSTAEEYMEYILQTCRSLETVLEQNRGAFLRFLREKQQGQYELTRDTYLFYCKKEG